MAFHVGQKVVCVDASFRPFGPWAKGEELIDGAFYTISAVGFSEDGAPGVQLWELPRTAPFYKWFNQKRFRPLTERKTEAGMAILRKVADDASKRRSLVVPL